MIGTQTALPLDCPGPRLVPTRPAGRPMTLRKAQRDYHAELEDAKAATCPCCGHRTRVYRRKLHAGLAATLCWLVREHVRTDDWVEVQASAPRHVLRNNEIGKLAAWGLAERQPSDTSSKRTSGIWRPTLLGEAWILNSEVVHSHAIFCNGTIEKFDGDLISIGDALGTKFDYKKLMTDNATK